MKKLKLWLETLGKGIFMIIGGLAICGLWGLIFIVGAPFIGLALFGAAILLFIFWAMP